MLIIRIQSTQQLWLTLIFEDRPLDIYKIEAKIQQLDRVNTK
jgi:hypothetical protein